MKIHKKILSLFMALSIIFSSAVPVFARSPPTVKDYWNAFLTGDYSTIDEYRQSQEYENCWTVGNAGGSFKYDNSWKNYYGQGGQFRGNKNSVNTPYNTGDTVYTSIVEYNSTSNSYTYNHINNNTYNNYNITEINYNNEYNTYEFVTDNEYNFYITYSPTYVTVMYYDTGTQQNIKNDYYYQLPDGRSSFDLTADEVWGTYFLYNAVNYNEVVEDDGKTLGLFHLDGDLKNSAAVNTSLVPTVTSQTYANGKFDLSLSQTCVDKVSRNISFNYPSNTIILEFWRYYSSLCYNSSGQSVSLSNIQPGFIRDYKAYEELVSVPTDSWHHYLIWKSGTTYYLFIDGRQSISLTGFPNISNTVYSTTKDSYDYYLVYSSSVYRVDEIRMLSKFPYSSTNFTPQSQPFDTNLVLVLPETGNLNDIAVKSNTPVTSLRVGGVRPTISTSGDVYVYLEDDIVKDVQQYQTDGWYSVDASIYERDSWVTLKDKDLSSYTITEDDFPSVDNPSDEDNENTDDEDKDETTGLLSSIMEKITGFFTGLLDVLFGGILDLITVITDNLTGIIDGFTGIIGLLGDLFGFLPQEMISVLTSGLAVIIIVVIIKIFI